MADRAGAVPSVPLTALEAASWKHSLPARHGSVTSVARVASVASLREVAGISGLVLNSMCMLRRRLASIEQACAVPQESFEAVFCVFHMLPIQAFKEIRHLPE